MIAQVESTQASRDQIWLHVEGCRVGDLAAYAGRTASPEQYPFASRIEQNVPVYSDSEVARSQARARTAVQAELIRALSTGPGVVVFRGAFEKALIAATTACFLDMLTGERRQGGNHGDHFAQVGANDRLWRVQQKLADQNPVLYADYYGNPVVELVSEAWLGPMYQVTSDINVVNPGSSPQRAHRDYHLGFMSPAQAARFPAHVHRFASKLTLQVAVAHCDMPVETGPTLYLPYSQNYESGYLAVAQPEFQQYFTSHCIQLPLQSGDAVFFNPALFHAAGGNHTANVRRIANLMQVSSAFGRAMGVLDRARMCRALYPELSRRWRDGQHDVVARVAKATAEGYAFPTNLDRDSPTSGMAAETQYELLMHAVEAQIDAERFQAQLDAQLERHNA